MKDVLVRYRFVLLGIVAVGLVAGAVLSQRTEEPPPGTDSSRPIGRLGPTPGPDAEGYVADKRLYLDRAAAEEPDEAAAALISLGRRHAPSEVEAIAADASVDVLFLSLPGADPEVHPVEGTVTGTVAERVEEVRADRASVLAVLEDRAAGTSGEERIELERQVAEARLDLDGLGPDCTCVFAFVLSGTTLGRLADLQASADVRLVDVPDPVVADLRGWELTPLLPKDAQSGSV